MEFGNLYNPHVSVVHNSRGNHFFSVMIMLPHQCSVHCRKFDQTSPIQSNDNDQYQLEFGFNVEGEPGWYEIEGVTTSVIKIGMENYNLIQFFRPIAHAHEGSAKFETRVHDHPHKNNGEEGITTHDGTVHLPGGN